MENISAVYVIENQGVVSVVKTGMVVGFLTKCGSISETIVFMKCSHAAMVSVYAVVHG